MMDSNEIWNKYLWTIAVPPVGYKDTSIQQKYQNSFGSVPSVKKYSAEERIT